MSKEPSMKESQMPPLCVDLDGTLIKTDLLWECLLLLFKQDLLSIFRVPLWLLKGRAHLKRKLAICVKPDVANLPYDDQFLAYLREEHQHGRKLILATATDEILARGIADYLGIFSEVIGSDGITNVSGSNKRRVLESTYGNHGFAYAGNSSVDLEVWSHAKEAIVTSSSAYFLEKVKSRVKVVRSFNQTSNISRALFDALRVPQWSKNVLIFIPVITAHVFMNVEIALQAFYAFSAFCLCSSAVYIWNDLLDLEADRYHDRKRHRPFADGRLPIWAGMALSLLLVISGLAVSLLLPHSFVVVLSTYVVFVLLYSYILKQVAIVDVIVLALLYALRIFAGSMATGVPISSWLLSFSFFLFLSLALLKRVSELHGCMYNCIDAAVGRGYCIGDLHFLERLGTVGGYLSLLVFMLYIASEDITKLYQTPGILWLICPLFFYWISRLWWLVNRGKLDDDPVRFALKDPTSYVIGLCVIFLMILAK